MINFYYYDAQLKKYLIQFCNIFAGLKVQTGNGVCDTPEFMTVPISIGSRDRVVAAIQAGNTQNRPFSLPTMAVAMTGLANNPDGRKGVGVVDRRTYLPQGGVYPTDIKTITRVMPLPYMMKLELDVYASNTFQLHQILEQILMLFDPVLQIQKNDSAFDWTKITSVELTDINNQENYPAGADKRILMWSFSFDMPIYISAPADIREEFVKTIIIRLGDLSGFSVSEYDENGNLVPFAPGTTYAEITVTEPPTI
jgi:hypothetical protein